MRTKLNSVPDSLWNLFEPAFKLELQEIEIIPVTDKEWENLNDR